MKEVTASVPGRVLNGRYRLGRVLGRGGMAEVHEAHDELLDRAVAVKMLRPDMAANPEVRTRFEVEARSAARLHHPNVVSIFDTGEDGGDPYLVMELLPGETLADRVRGGPVSPEWLCRVAADVLAALGAAHDAGLVHRDVKPANVLLTSDGRAKVADFGIAKSVEAVGADITGTGLLVGTPAYLAPERVQGHPATARSDLYSVGVVLYEALAGDKPFAGGTPMAMAGAITTMEPPPLEALRPGLDPRLVAAVVRAMSRDPAERPATAAEMAADLGLAAAEDSTVVMAGAPVAAGEDATVLGGPGLLSAPGAAAPPALAPVFAGRRRLVAGLLAAIAVVLLALLVSSMGGGSTGPGGGDDGLSKRLEDLADRVEEGDGAKGPDAAEQLRDVAEQVEAGGGGDAATELLRDAAGWNASGQLSGAAYGAMVDLLRQVPRVDPSVLTTTTVPPAPPPPPPPGEDEKDEEEEEDRGKGKGRGKGRD